MRLGIFSKTAGLLALLALMLGFGAGQSQAQVTTNFTGTNIIRFAATNFIASEDSIEAVITVLRVGVLTNSDLVSVEFSMVDGTALSGTHYYKVTGTVIFPPGEDRTTFRVPLIDNFSAGGDVFLTMFLSRPGGGDQTFATLGPPSTATLTISDDETVQASSDAGFVEIAPGSGGASRFVVENNTYLATREEWNVDQDNNANFVPYGPAGVEVTIVRKGGSRGRILVDWQTTTNVVPLFSEFFFFDFFDIFGGRAGGGLAIPNEDFVPTNGTVVMDDYQMASRVLVRLPAVIQQEPYFNASTNFFAPPVTFGVELTGVRAAPEEAGQNVNPTLGSAIQRRIGLVNIDEGFSFSRLHYRVSEGQRFVRVRVRRSATLDPMNPVGPVHVHYSVNPRAIVVGQPDFPNRDRGGDHQGNNVPLEPGSEYSTPYVDYEPPWSDMWRDTMEAEAAAGRGQVQDVNEGTLTWGDGDVTDRFIVIPLLDDNDAEFDEDMNVVLWKHAGEDDGRVNFSAGTCTIKIDDNDQPAGMSSVVFNPDNDPLTDPPYMTVPGANNTVQAVAAQPDGKVVLGGDFSAVNTLARGKIARLNFDGSTDRSFNPGTGVSGFVRALALQPDGRILVAGGFDAVNGIPRFNIARLMTNGTLDATFNPGLGTDAPIRAIAVQPDGKILIGGDFNTVGGTNRNYIARLTSDGKLDTTFDPGFGPDAPVNSIAVNGSSLDIDREAAGGPAEDRFLVDTGSSRGTIVVNYDFLAVPDAMRVYYNGVAIFDSGFVSSNGVFNIQYPPAGTAADTTLVEIVMNEGSGLVGTVWYYDLQIQPETDPRPVIGGEFTDYNGRSINYIARLNVDGSLDTTFDPGTGANDKVYAVVKQGNKVIMAGDFTSVDLRERGGVARLNEDGSLDGRFEPGVGFDNSVFTAAIMPDGKAVFGGAFRSFNETRRIGLARLNLDGTLDTSFMDTAKNQFAGIPNPLSKENTESQENFLRSLAPYRMTNPVILTNLVVDTNNVTNEVYTTNITLVEHLFVGGRFSRFGGGFRRDEIRPRLNIARLNAGATPGPGNITFLRDSYSVDENAGSTFITLARTNGSLAPISVHFNALDRQPVGPGVAASGADYLSTNYTPIWIRSHDIDREYGAAFMGPNYNAFTTNRGRGDFTTYTNRAKPGFRYLNYDDDNIFVAVFDDNVFEGDEVVDLILNAPDEGRFLLGGQPIPVGTALGRAKAQLIIADNEFNYGTLGFSDPEYFVNEDGIDASITVTRVGGSSGAVTVDVNTLDGTAGVLDYNGIAKRTLTFANGQTSTKFTIRIRNDTIAELEETVRLFLTNATGFPSDVPANLRLDPARATSTLNILDDDFAFGRISFTAANYTVSESESAVTVTVRRSGGNLADVSVSYRTADGTARAGEDYSAVQGILKWTDGESGAKSFTIPLLPDGRIEPEETINVHLSDATIEGAIGAQPSAVVRIQNDDSAGVFSFSQILYNVDENAPYADITVVRDVGIAGAVSVHYAVTNLTAFGTTNVDITFAPEGIPDYVFPELIAANGFTNILRFAEGETAASFRVPLINDGLVEGEKRIALSLLSPSAGTQISLGTATLVIVDDELNRIPAGQLDTTFLATGTDDYVYSLALQADGKILLGGDFKFINDVSRNRLARLLPDGPLDNTFDPSVGPDGSVRTLLVEPDSRLLIGGLFNSIGGTNRSHLARLNIDSSVDPTFEPGAGTDNPIFSQVRQADGKVIVVGNFSTFRGVSRKSIARVSTNGLLDTAFDPGTGANGAIWSAAIQRDGKILIGGDFTTYNEQPRSRIARLNQDGTLDETFGSSGSGADGSVRSIAVQSNGDLLIGGLFSTVNGRPFNRIARLKAAGGAPGQLDDSFNLGIASDAARATNGANGAVNVIAVQLDGKILLGGDFTTFNNRTRNRLTRLNSDGSLDPTINFGSGANGPISAIVVQPDRRILIAGGFTIYDGTPARNIARIHGGAISGSGRVQFTSPFFSASESEENAIVNIRRTGGTTGALSVTVLTTTNDTAVVGVDFTAVTNLIEFPEAETFRSVLIPLKRNTNALQDRFITVILTNVVGDGSLGTQPNARVTIVNSDARIEFSRAEYSITEDFVTGSASITVRRTGSTALPLSVDFATQDDTATAGPDYQAVNTTLTFAPGEASRTLAIPVFDDLLVEGNERVKLRISNLLGEGMISMPEAVLTIVENDFSPGQVEFTSATYFGSEASRQVIVRVRRVGGTTGVISVDYATRPGGENPAQPPSDYVDVTGIVAFSDGEDLKSFVIAVQDDPFVEGNESFVIRLSNPKGNTSIIGPVEALGVIVDDDLPSGSLDRTFDTGVGVNGEVRVIKLDSSGRVVFGGDFTSYNSVNRSHIARVSLDGALDSGFDPGVGPNGTVAAIAFDPDLNLILGGGFNTVQGFLLNRVARLKPDASVDASFSLPLGLNAEVSELARQPDGKIVIGGMFDLASAAGRNRIARLNADGTVDLSFNPGSGADANVTALALLPSGQILVGGAFSSVNGVQRRGLARLNADGSVDGTFNSGSAGAFGGGVEDILLLEGGKILIVGDFTSFNGAARTRSALLNADGSLDESFSPGVGPNRVIYAVDRQSDGKFIIVGDFTSVSGATRNRIARLNANGSHDTEFRPGTGANGAVLAVKIQQNDGRILIGGRFTEVDSEPRARIARLNNDRGFVVPQVIAFTGAVRVNGHLEFTASTQPGFTYTLESRTSLGGSTAWRAEQTAVAVGASTVFSVTPSEEFQFFRLRRD